MIFYLYKSQFQLQPDVLNLHFKDCPRFSYVRKEGRFRDKSPRWMQSFRHFVHVQSARKLKLFETFRA